MEYVTIIEPTLFGVPVVAVSGDGIAYDIDAGPVSLAGRRNVGTVTSAVTGNQISN